MSRPASLPLGSDGVWKRRRRVLTGMVPVIVIGAASLWMTQQQAWPARVAAALIGEDTRGIFAALFLAGLALLLGIRALVDRALAAAEERHDG